MAGRNLVYLHDFWKVSQVLVIGQYGPFQSSAFLRHINKNDDVINHDYHGNDK